MSIWGENIGRKLKKIKQRNIPQRRYFFWKMDKVMNPILIKINPKYVQFVQYFHFWKLPLFSIKVPRKGLKNAHMWPYFDYLQNSQNDPFLDKFCSFFNNSVRTTTSSSFLRTCCCMGGLRPPDPPVRGLRPLTTPKLNSTSTESGKWGQAPIIFPDSVLAVS